MPCVFRVDHETAICDCMPNHYNGADANCGQHEDTKNLEANTQALTQTLASEEVNLVSQMCKAQRVLIFEMLVLRLEELRLFFRNAAGATSGLPESIGGQVQFLQQRPKPRLMS